MGVMRPVAGILALTTQDGREFYLRADQVEAVLPDPNGSRVRSCSQVWYHCDERPYVVMERWQSALDWAYAGKKVPQHQEAEGL